MRKVLFIISQLYRGGAESSLVNLLYTLPRAEYQVDLLVLNQGNNNRALSLLPNAAKRANTCDGSYRRLDRWNPVQRFRRRFIFINRLSGKGTDGVMKRGAFAIGS